MLSWTNTQTSIASCFYSMDALVGGGGEIYQTTYVVTV